MTLRRRAGLTQGELAALSGVSQPNISRLEHYAPRTVKASTRRLLAAALGVANPTLLQFGANPAARGAVARERRRVAAGGRDLAWLVHHDDDDDDEATP